MRRLAKNLILATAVVSAIFLVDLSSAEATSFAQGSTIFSRAPEKITPLKTDNIKRKYIDFWSKFRDTVMPDEPQDNNPPKELKKPKPVEKPKPAPKPRPKPAH